MITITLLPAIRSRVGDWNYYVTTLTFQEVANLVQAPDEVHERKKLSDWIQREAITGHADAIAAYIEANKQRFLGSLIVGVYGGDPNWTPVKVRFPARTEISAAQKESIEGRLGMLHLTGAERLFAIDGQHRVAGIKKALERETGDCDLRNESIGALFVAHDPFTEAGKVRTRRLFTTVNKKARVISKAAAIALDEDNGFAIVTRRLIDEHWLFEDKREFLAYGSAGSISASDTRSITSVVGLYEIVRDLYGTPKGFDKERPRDTIMDNHLKLCMEFLDTVVKKVPELRKVLMEGVGNAGDYRQPKKNHMLFRPIGQRAFARATQLVISRGSGIAAAIKSLLVVNLYLQKKEWAGILWDPIGKTMITNKVVVAEAQLLRLAGLPLRSKASGKRLQAILNAQA